MKFRVKMDAKPEPVMTRERLEDIKTSVAPYLQKKSEIFLKTATQMLAEQFMRLGKLTHEDALELSKSIVPTIDWDNEALMHKGFAWIAKQYLKFMEVKNGNYI